MKLLIIKSATESKWGSCKIISPNLHKLYHQLEDYFQVKWVGLPEDLLKNELGASHSFVEKLLHEIESFGPDRIAFVDHLPPPPSVLAYLAIIKNLRKLCPLIFHIYGDFTYFSKEWIYLNETLVGHPMTFIVASESQRRLVSSFLEASHTVEKLCFPVDSADYFYDDNERRLFREEHNVAPDETIILYSGRISLQKNVDIIIRKFLEASSLKQKLWIVGSFDDVGADFIGFNSYPGYMFQKIESTLSFASADEKKRIVFWGHQSKEVIRKINSASDLFVSFSLYHDEDYGMSPAEALATGLKSILTDWGGYSSFASKKEWDCRLAPVSLSEFGHELSTEEFTDFLAKPEIDNKIDRAKRAAEFLEAFSIQGNVRTLSTILKQTPQSFLGFNWKLGQFAEALNLNWSRSKFNKYLMPKNKSFYSEVYRNYISRNLESK